MRAACRLPWLEELSVINQRVTDAAAEDIRYLTNLRLLDLRLNRGSPAKRSRTSGSERAADTDAVLQALPVPARDEDMAFLRRLTRLERLNLETANLDDAWLVYLEGLENLKDSISPKPR